MEEEKGRERKREGRKKSVCFLSVLSAQVKVDASDIVMISHSLHSYAERTCNAIHIILCGCMVCYFWVTQYRCQVLHLSTAMNPEVVLWWALVALADSCANETPE